MGIYLDNAATTPLAKEVKDYVVSVLDCYGNPSSLYGMGVVSKRIIDDARDNVAKFINANPDDIIFTPSGSASNTLGIKGYVEKNRTPLLYSSIAHKSIQKCAESLGGISIPVDKYGIIDTTWLDNYLRCIGKCLVVVDYANSEIGTVQDVKAIIDIVHKYDGICMLDCTGSISTIPVDVQGLDVDMLTFSAHKLGALKGCGVLYKKSHIELNPLIYGSQEQGLAAGTENIIGIAALGKAIELVDYSKVSNAKTIYMWRFLNTYLDDIYMVGHLYNRLTNNLYICFKGVSGEDLMTMLDQRGIQVSTGSACNSGDKTPSPTLSAIHMSKEDMFSCVRFTFSGNESIADIDYVCETIILDVNILRGVN